jgi:hypothetical protein
VQFAARDALRERIHESTEGLVVFDHRNVSTTHVEHARRRTPPSSGLTQGHELVRGEGFECDQSTQGLDLAAEFFHHQWQL